MIAAEAAPLHAPVVIHWEDHAIPYLEAEHDEDLATALGLVHAHLRLGQMEIMRRLARGRVAEMVGPLGVEIDRALRLFDFGRAVDAIVAGLDAETRRWAEGFLRGVNHQLMHGPRPHECELLGIGREPWTLADLFTTARLAAVDVSWLVFGRLLRARGRLERAEWEALWPLLLGAGAPPLWPPAGEPVEADDIAGLTEAALARAARGGSNSCAVAGSRTASGAAMIASDPHLGLALPNTWLIAGFSSPGYNAVGLMLAGFPFVALGRNRWIGWGGTSLHAASSELYDLSRVAAREIIERRETVRVRWGRARRIRLRESPLGPVVSDGPLLKSRAPLALRWVGHGPSDEMGAMLAVARARDWTDFRAALRGFAVPGQTMVYADAQGHVGRLTAAHLPRRAASPPPDLVADPGQAWPLTGLATSDELPCQADPPEGFVVSANERPDGGDIPVGYFFSSGERARRMQRLLARPEPLTEPDLRLLQRDVAQPGVLPLRDLLLSRAPDDPATAAAREVLAEWDGRYAGDAAGPVAFEALLATVAQGLRRRHLLAPYQAVWITRALVTRDILQAPPQTLTHLIGRGMREATRALRRDRVWGRMHRFRVAHHFAALPVIGRRYVFARFPGEGGSETLYKTGHPLTASRHAIGFGSCARHVSDLADPDANRFVLFGGQDGWLGSANATDQVPLWRTGRMITVPLRAETARARFGHRTVLRPAG